MTSGRYYLQIFQGLELVEQFRWQRCQLIVRQRSVGDSEQQEADGRERYIM